MLKEASALSTSWGIRVALEQLAFVEKEVDDRAINGYRIEKVLAFSKQPSTHQSGIHQQRASRVVSQGSRPAGNQQAQLKQLSSWRERERPWRHLVQSHVDALTRQLEQERANHRPG